MAALKGAKGVDEQRLAQIAPDATVGGEISKIINEAKSYKYSAEEQVRAEANQFERVYPLYKENPQAYMALTWEGMRAEVLKSRLVQIWTVDGSQKTDLWLELNNDPRWSKARETEAAQRQIAEEKRKKDEALRGGK